MNVHGPVPVHGPDQPVKPESDVGVAISATSEPIGKFAVHVAPQSMPAGLERTPPVPVPVDMIVTAAVGPEASGDASGLASRSGPSLIAASIASSSPPPPQAPTSTTAASASARGARRLARRRRRINNARGSSASAAPASDPPPAAQPPPATP